MKETFYVSVYITLFIKEYHADCGRIFREGTFRELYMALSCFAGKSEKSSSGRVFNLLFKTLINMKSISSLSKKKQLVL